MATRTLLILLTVALASGAQAAAERDDWVWPLLAPDLKPSIDGGLRLGFHPAAQAGAG